MLLSDIDWDEGLFWIMEEVSKLPHVSPGYLALDQKNLDWKQDSEDEARILIFL